MAVSERCWANTGWVRNGVSRSSSDGSRTGACCSRSSASGTSTPNAAQTARKESAVVSSSQAMPTVSSSTRRRFTPRSTAAATTAAARPGTRAVTVSKSSPAISSTPPARSPSASAAACRCTRAAIARSPSGPWYTAYMPAMTASSTWAVQMLLVAFSRRMCCSRVCSASRYAGCPSASTETPTRRPGSERASDSRTAMKAACGPPKPSGTPKRWEDPTTMSAPSSPGGRSKVSASRSVATATSAPAACTRSISGASGRTSPPEPG